MDAEKLPEALTLSQALPPASSTPCPCVEECAPLACRPGCALEIVDELLAGAGLVTGEEADYLLDFRQLLQARRDAEGTLRLFCELRRRLEQRHYLLFYRLRRWLEHQIVAEVRCGPGAEPVRVSLRLNFYCQEAVRRLCLCQALGRGTTLARPQLGFVFLPLPAMPVKAGPAVEQEKTEV